MRAPFILFIAATAAAVACTAESTTAPVQVIETTTFASSLGITLSQMTKTSDGLYYQDAPAGTGTTSHTGDHVTVKYKAYLSNGALVDSSNSFAFTLGASQVIKGWDEGVAGMKIGGTRKLVIPPELAYDGAAVGNIPANSIMVFSVTLNSIP